MRLKPTDQGYVEYICPNCLCHFHSDRFWSPMAPKWFCRPHKDIYWVVQGFSHCGVGSPPQDWDELDLGVIKEPW